MMKEYLFSFPTIYLRFGRKIDNLLFSTTVKRFTVFP